MRQGLPVAVSLATSTGGSHQDYRGNSQQDLRGHSQQDREGDVSEDDEAVPEEGLLVKAPVASPSRSFLGSTSVPMVSPDAPAEDSEVFEEWGLGAAVSDHKTLSKRGAWVDWDCEELPENNSGAHSELEAANSSSLLRQAPRLCRSLSEDHLRAARSLLGQAIDPFSDEPTKKQLLSGISTQGEVPRARTSIETAMLLSQSKEWSGAHHKLP
jgi:hypothetical protein